jgi:hypothetical protein
VDEEKLSNLDELPEDEFRPAFLEEVHRFIKCALHSSPPKVVNQVEITGHRKSDYYLKRLPRESETECMEAFILPDTLPQIFDTFYVFLSDFNYLAESYVGSLNNGSTPTIPSIINHIVAAEFIREKDSITNYYRKKMNERLVKPMSVDELNNFNSELRSESMKRFKNHKVLQKASNTNEMEQKLTVSID